MVARGEAVSWHLSHPEYGNKPWAVQAEALARASDKLGYGYWLEQGLGKTPLALNEFYDKWLRNLVDACVIVCPNSIKKDWADGVTEWGIPSDHITGYYWPYLDLPGRLENAVLAINYEAVTRPGKVRDYMVWLMEQSRIFLVLDETSSLGNPTSQNTKAIIELAKRAAYRRGLNGTPLTRTVMDYWGQLRAIGELNGTNPFAFKARFATLGGFMGKQIKGIKNEDQLTEILDRCTFRALKSEWRKDLPPKVHSVLRLDMTKRQQFHYEEMMEGFYTLVSGLEITADMVLTQMWKLRQISSCLVLNEGKYEWIEKPKDNPKLQATIEWVKGSPGKAMVTAVFRPSVQLLFDTFKGLGLNPVLVQGGMTPDQWTDSKNRFNRDPKCRVLVGQQSAVFRGHTLIGGPGDWCSRMCCYETSFSYYERAQLEDRIHRGAQQETCNYVDFVSSPVDTRTLDVIRGKKDQAGFMDGLVAAIRNREW